MQISLFPSENINIPALFWGKSIKKVYVLFILKKG